MGEDDKNPAETPAPDETPAPEETPVPESVVSHETENFMTDVNARFQELESKMQTGFDSILQILTPKEEEQNDDSSEEETDETPTETPVDETTTETPTRGKRLKLFRTL